jgi:hypothetical protein
MGQQLYCGITHANDFAGVFLTKDTGLKNKLQREVNGYRQPVEVHCRSDT